MVNASAIVAVVCVLLGSNTSFGFAPGFSTLTVRPGHTFSEALSASAGDDQGGDEGSKDEGSEDDATCGKKTKFVDDGTRAGPETLTDRFKYSVNALMGNYDPEEGEDSEEAVADTFAIADALVKEKGGWPAVFDFVAVGSGEEFESNCVVAVKEVIPKGASFTHEVKNVGTKFTRVSFSRKVEDAKTLSSIYRALDQVPNIKFKY
ncbi:hypothetical protein TrST_g1122 [Triparma strigata]|uniref:Uncharacterized protein n=1 Tax=Triparma strigata TaxID=1606541 RepID=A0A9W7AG39_9STRA|nr:hypothetical protein TrST_g1122 [Triparma strigata]